jgi:hypothetical protein
MKITSPDDLVDALTRVPIYAPALEAMPPVIPLMNACWSMPSFKSFPSILLAIILVPAPAAALPNASDPMMMPTFVVFERVIPPKPPAIAPPAMEIGAAMIPPAAPMPEEMPHLL